jgi:hypothetical protein
VALVVAESPDAASGCVVLPVVHVGTGGYWRMEERRFSRHNLVAVDIDERGGMHPNLLADGGHAPIQEAGEAGD